MTVFAFLLAGCPAEADLAKATNDSGGSADSADSGGADTEVIPGECPADAGYVGEAPHDARTLVGEGTWTLDFDAEAEALGYVDCRYHRQYAVSTEREGHRWQCPECDWFTMGDATVDVGYDDCFLSISSADQTRTEHLGFATGDDGLTHLWRTGAENVTLADMGAVTGAGSEADPYVGGWTDDGAFDAGGGFTLVAELSLVQGVDPGVSIADVDVPREEPYACGWPTCNPGGPAPSWTLTTGGVLPNGRFFDTCGDEVDLWDFWGRYLVIDASAPNCGPCQAMAQDEGAWVESMAARGIEVQWITLLNSSLSEVNGAATPEQLQTWVDAFGSTGPVLSDEGYGYDLFMPYRGDGSSSYPTLIVVDPEMRVLGWDAGYATVESGGDGFGPIEALIAGG